MAEGKTITIIQKGKTIDPIRLNLELVFTTTSNVCNDPITQYWVGFKVLNSNEDLIKIGEKSATVSTHFKWNFQNTMGGGYGEEQNYPCGFTLVPGQNDYTCSVMTIDSALNMAGQYYPRAIANLVGTAKLTIAPSFLTLGNVTTNWKAGDCEHQIYYPSLDGYNGVPIQNNF